ncbi:MAG: hypothetical protein Q4P33_05140 [Flaviflexus sp.]|nr:hypothetical protein [Flaviflexus sp.]
MKLIRKMTTGLCALAMAASLAAPASADTWTHYSMGGKVRVVGATISLKDISDDGRFVAARYKYGFGRFQAGISNKAGYGTTESTTQSSNITNDKICRSRWFKYMECGTWKFAE